MPGPYRTEALVIRVVAYGETSQVVHLATPEHGLVAAMAKGATRPTGAFQGGLSLLALGTAELAPRRGAELELLRTFVRVDALRSLTDTLPRYYAACYVVDLLRSWMRPALANPALYGAARSALEGLAQARDTAVATWVVWFEARGVAATGHRPVIGACAVCGRELERGGRFSPEAGGMAHRRCAPTGLHLDVSAEGHRVLGRLYTERRAELARERPSREGVRQVRAVHDLWIPYLIERRPAGMRTLPRF